MLTEIGLRTQVPGFFLEMGRKISEPEKLPIINKRTFVFDRESGYVLWSEIDQLNARRGLNSHVNCLYVIINASFWIDLEKHSIRQLTLFCNPFSCCTYELNL